MTVLDLQNNNRQLHPKETASLTVSVALGCFDGVHLGHAALLSAACDEARRCGAAPAVWTFTEPPFPGRTKLLSTMEQKLALFASHGIRYAFLYDFSEVRNLSPAEFVDGILIGQCHAAACVCGFNFRFAKDAAGTIEVLADLLRVHGSTLHVVSEVTFDGLPVSATRIRGLLSAGDTVGAARCLGRAYALTLPVVHGKALGRTIGIPTINQNPPPQMQIPAHGTYAATAWIDGHAFPAVTNVGQRPSIAQDDHVPNIETHIIGYSGWLYGDAVTVAFRERLREEMSFPSLDALKAQIAEDIRASVASFDETQESI